MILVLRLAWNTNRKILQNYTLVVILSIIQGNDIISVAYIMQNIKPTSLGKKTKSESGLSLIKMFLFWPRSVIPFGHMRTINRIGLIVHELHFFLQSWNFWSISICIGAGMLVFYRILLVSSIESTFNNAISLQRILCCTLY